MDDGVLATENDFSGRSGLHSELLCGHRREIEIGGALLTTSLLQMLRKRLRILDSIAVGSAGASRPEQSCPFRYDSTWASPVLPVNRKGCIS